MLLNNRAPKCMKQNLTEWKGEIVNSTIIVGELISPFNMDKTTRLKVSMKIEDLTDFVNQLVLTHL